jgi:hypothetical protein
LSVEDDFACGVEIGAPKPTPVARLVVLETERRPQGQRALIARFPAQERGPREGAPAFDRVLVYPADGNRGGLSGRHGHRAESRPGLPRPAHHRTCSQQLALTVRCVMPNPAPMFSHE